MFMSINFGNVGIHNEEFPYIKSPDALIMLSYKVM